MTEPRDTVQPGAWWKREQMGRKPRTEAPSLAIGRLAGVSRELHLYGEPHVVIVQCNEDPGDMGEPRMVSEDDTTYVFVPAFDLWPGSEAARAAAGHRTPESHDCFLMNCKDLGDEVRRLQVEVSAARAVGVAQERDVGQMLDDALTEAARAPR